MKSNRTTRIFSVFLLAFFAAVAFYFTKPAKLDSATLTAASATLSNSRLSYRAGVGATALIADSVIDIDSSGNADNDTNHLFPNDNICFARPVESGCIGDTNYDVARIQDTDTFVLETALSVGVSVTDYAVATSSGVLTMQFTLASEIPADGDILLTIPAVDTTGKTDDGIPDTAAAVANNGFDLNNITTGEITFAGGTGCSWTTTSATTGTASADHLIIGTTSATCTAGVITITVGDSGSADTLLVNPAPISSGHTQGVANVYEVSIVTRDESDIQIDNVNTKVAPVEAVLVSATIDETLEFTVAGRAVGTTACGVAADKTTTAYSVPWGTIASFDTFYNASQQLTVSTNADGGYAVTVEENDQMGKDGVTCTGAAAAEADNCIQDTTCNVTGCDESTSQEWTTASGYEGLGYSLENLAGTDAAFLYNESARSFSAKQFADIETPETKQTVMSNVAPVNSNDIYVCYRISIINVQPAGHYYNKVKYIATATF